MTTREARKAEFERIAAEAAANVKALREEEAKCLLGVQEEHIRRRLDLERAAAEQGVTLPPVQDELAARRKKIGDWPGVTA
ncbi:MAG TPA: hypothetical protein VNM48_13395 [Chloroflexota bacterium]|nr:hypothetical protein [Chloroflexota bacterium]